MRPYLYVTFPTKFPLKCNPHKSVYKFYQTATRSFVTIYPNGHVDRTKIFLCDDCLLCRAHIFSHHILT